MFFCKVFVVASLAVSLVSAQLRALQTDFLCRMQTTMCRAINAGQWSVIENMVGVPDPLSFVCCSVCESRLSPYGTRTLTACNNGCARDCTADTCVADTPEVQEESFKAVCASAQIACGKEVDRPAPTANENRRCVDVTMEKCMADFQANLGRCKTEAGNDFGRCTEARFEQAYSMVSNIPCSLFALGDPSEAALPAQCPASC
uniref:VDE lipocalin domain-containing protein n=1 Tax=Chromera velia CCMP2878 TaxID=1169474 RepID=A0A0G4GAD2_9ALVE|mmetsp:Transcript_34867/g.68841  ORF Transcript_34867/g.68841 Transcript_34867/m.68841 type:complete len:203 (-) Transcript_34867:448-1056(-)|eukprot:Cvel_20951.t1-p1 / transcript=Cvel_20951.t1 / gene=Cvel_20951 / organism=Chromera_velia_CCMP2878 / gene_product=hypothetical protein / transcript_product=hypothetical protein / location=Cvel_scaffold1925:16580-17473(+) / protein_length=202 / sequence_SO=supercontig / SO=protein_coding / is_pseudo=false